MKTWPKIAAALAIAASLHLGVLAAEREPLPVLNALPSTALGSNWTQHISMLFDPASKPAEIIDRSNVLPETRRNEHRQAVANPTNRISGWSHLHYDFRGTNTNQRYELHVERYRSEPTAIDDFTKLLASQTKDYQKADVPGLGDQAVVFRNTNVTTLWFRRGPFRIWISPLFGATRWETDSALQELAKAFDTHLKTKLSAPTTKTKAEKTQPDPLKKSLGQRVTLTGIAESWKVGAALRGDDFFVFVDGLHDWSEAFNNHKVQISGVLEERHDLPVFVADTVEERAQFQGIPVPSGTDLEEASRRYVVRDATWKLAQ